MSYNVFCTFDLKNASSQDYLNAYADLEKIGLRKIVANSAGGKTVIPTTAAMGEFTATNAAALRDDMRSKVQALFKARRFTSEIFVVVGGVDWGWGAIAT